MRLREPLLLAGGLGLATLAIAVRDPHVRGSWGFCPSALLGFWCPGCGGLRGVHDLTRLDVGAAASSNLVLVVAVPLFALWFGWWTVRRWRGATGPSTLTRLGTALPLAGLALVVLVTFAVLRNTPTPLGLWLAP